MKRCYLLTAFVFGLLLLVGLTNWGSERVDAYPNLGSNCAGCHGSKAPPPAKPAPKPAPSKPAASKPAPEPAKPKPALTAKKPAPAVPASCSACHPGVTSPVAGKGCGDCHKGGAAHMKAPSAANIKSEPVSMALMFTINTGSTTHLSLSKQGAQACAGCHKHACGDAGNSGVLVPIKNKAGDYLGWAEVRNGAAYLLGTNTQVRSMHKNITWEPGPGGGAQGATIWVSS
ncbi:MAG: hypothetical protein AB1426_09000 [Bacillota bacterium]